MDKENETSETGAIRREKILRENGVQLQIRKKIKEEISFLPDVRLYYIIEGMLEVKIGEKCYRMKKDDILLLNLDVSSGNAETVGEKNLICEISIDNRLLAELLENENGRFVCNSVEHPGQSYERMKKIIQQILRQRVLNQHKTKSYEYSLSYRLLDELIEHYWIVNSEIQVSREVTDPRLEEILRYVHCNHSAHISLAEVAEKLYVSTSTLSRFFKKQTGMYFAEYVGKIRLHYAENELKNTSHSITEVAMHCGFSNVQALNKVFREKLQMTPTELREQWAKRKEREDEDWKEAVRQELQKTEWFYEMQEHAVDQIRIDTSRQSESRLQKIWKRAINIGSLHRLGEVNIQFQTQMLVKELGFTHVRVWNIFSEPLMITDGKRVGNYNYDKIDQIMDFLAANHIALYLDFSRRMDAALISEGEPLYYKEEHIAFDSKELWESLLIDFLSHLSKRYGKSEVENWIFELADFEDGILLEPTGFYDYYEMYRFFYRAVKREFPNAKVGGYSAPPGQEKSAFPKYLRYCRKNDCVPDFVAVMIFPYEAGENAVGYRRVAEDHWEKNLLLYYRKCMEAENLSSCELYVSEWNMSLSNRNFLNDSCFRSAYFVKMISEIYELTDMICLWFGSDWISNYYDARSMVNGAGGILTKDNIKKPIWYALSFLNQLGEELLAVGEHYLITRRNNESYMILCFNFKQLGVSYFYIKENEVSLGQIRELFENSDSIQVDIQLENLTIGETYIVKKRQINSEYGCVLTEWAKMGMAVDLERSDIKYIEGRCVPNLEREQRKAEAGNVEISCEIRDQEMILYHIYPK